MIKSITITHKWTLLQERFRLATHWPNLDSTITIKNQLVQIPNPLAAGISGCSALIFTTSRWPVRGRFARKAGTIEKGPTVWARPLTTRYFLEISKECSMSRWEESASASCILTYVKALVKLLNSAFFSWWIMVAYWKGWPCWLFWLLLVWPHHSYRHHFIHSGALASSYLTWFPWTGLEQVNVTQWF